MTDFITNEWRRYLHWETSNNKSFILYGTICDVPVKIAEMYEVVEGLFRADAFGIGGIRPTYHYYNTSKEAEDYCLRESKRRLHHTNLSFSKNARKEK